MAITAQRKAEIARINGAMSRGPITPEGKAHSSRNGIRHRLTVRDPCLTARRSQAHIDHFRPVTTYEFDIVDQLAAIARCIRRAESIEIAFLDQETDIRKPISC